ncbi:hypothetical protein BDV25DRAFT_153641 [Aspergillus avenaceus]|uniref:Uncharacterized protein n=1 Tax=Aspergillus avenaceus TaxID=36643 RepID=A0A5N6TWY5_ASPAV|nr:hypothetical protein BDV25DRAFT_153641 [Aspergillus avenaceus]
MRKSHRTNFASFLAKLASAGANNDRLCQIGLVLLRDTLESTRPIGSHDEPDVDDPNRTMGDLSIAALLPAVLAW